MNFKWDEDKNQKNIEKHGLHFHDAELVFAGKVVTFSDDRNDYGEERFITLGELMNRVVVVVHTQRHFTMRIISMRKANEREKRIYFKRLEEVG
jgi:uncharacterized DUF497 family protein